MCFEIHALSREGQEVGGSSRRYHIYLHPLSNLKQNHTVLCSEYSDDRTSCDATSSGLESLAPGAKLAALEYLEGSHFVRSNPKLKDALQPAIMRAQKAVELEAAMKHGPESAKLLIGRRKQVGDFLNGLGDRKDLEPLKGWGLILKPVERWFNADGEEVECLQEIGEGFECQIDEVFIA
ncbi:hypothetical protein MMC10_004711 [Thelotrema lepadinum]|nr:hypothetical protein [Thelotrema lepadinum]